MDAGSLARELRAEALRSDERRLLVITGGEEATVRSVVDALDVDRTETTLVGDRDLLPCERLGHDRVDRLLGTTRSMVVLDARDRFVPNALGRAVGAVDGGGLLVVLAPPLDRWPDRRDEFDETLAVEPFEVGDVTGHFRRRVVRTLRSHPGVAVYDAETGRVERDGLTDPPPRPPRRPVEAPERGPFPAAAYEACLTRDQADAVRAFEPFHPLAEGVDKDPAPRAVVLEADRGRGKSSAAGLSAASLALAGEDVLVTAPSFRSTREAFARARELLSTVGTFADGPAGDGGDVSREIRTNDGGAIRYRPPEAAVEVIDEADVVVVDEAAALPVGRLSATLAADRVAYATTVHGYEGAGMGFSVRFRDELSASDHEVTEVELTEPIRYAPGDPVESWAFRALLLDARPAVDPLVRGATPESCRYRRIDPPDLVADEHLLREVFGLLVLAHYRTEPDDLARLLDAPNLWVRALTRDGHVTSVALLAREGDLPTDRRAAMYEGERVRGHMLPDVLTSQLRDERAGIPTGWRVMRIATHHAVRSAGLGSALLGSIRDEVAGEGADWLGVGYGATPELLEFWSLNGFRTVHLSTTSNDRSGEHSALMLDPITEAGRDLADRHARRFVDRVAAMATDSLSGVDPDVLRESLGSAGVRCDPDLSAAEWRTVVGASYGPGMYSVDPGPFRRLAVAHLADPDSTELSDRQERLLVRAILQARQLQGVAESMGYHSVGNCLRSIGEAYRPLVDRYGDEVAREERDRFRD